MNIKWQEENGYASELMTFEVGMIISVKNYNTYLKVKEDFPSDARELRCNTFTIED